MHETALCRHTPIYLSNGTLQQQRTIYHLYFGGDNTSTTHQEVLVLSPQQQNINGKICSVLTNNMNFKGPT